MNDRRKLVIALAAALGIGLAAGGVDAGGWGYGPGGDGMRMDGPGYQARAGETMRHRHQHRHLRGGGPALAATPAGVPQATGPGTGWRAQLGLCPRANVLPQATGDAGGQAPASAAPGAWRPQNATGPRAQMGFCPSAQTQPGEPEGSS